MNSAQNISKKQNYKTALREVYFPLKDKIHFVGIVFDRDEGIPFPIPGKFGTSVSIEEFSFKQGKRLDNKSNNIVFSSDLNLFKLPPKRIIQPFVEKTFDILINVTDGTNHTLNYICAKSKAKFKVSYVRVENIFDLVIPLEKEKIQLLPEELINILTNLNK